MANRWLRPTGDGRWLRPTGDGRWLRPTVDGRWLAPAFADRHCHPLFAAREAASIDLSGLDSVDAILGALKTFLLANPDAKWIDATPFDRSIASEFNASTLDEVSNCVPITLHSSDHHALWVNSAALAIANLDINLPELDDGEVVVDAIGHASGLLLEWSAMKLVLDHQPAPTLEADLSSLGHAQARMREVGIIKVSDAWIDPGMGEVYLEAVDRGMLNIDVELWVRTSPAELDQSLLYLKDLCAKATNTNRVRVAGIKLFLDGVLSSKTAAVLEPYSDGSFGSLIWSDAQLDELLAKSAKIDSQLRPHFHAIGDRAVRQALDAISRARNSQLWSAGARPVVAHAELISTADAPRFAELDVEVVVSPQWLIEDTDRIALKQLISQDAYDRLGDFTDLIQSKASVTYGSDWPVTPPEPLVAIAETVWHLTARGFDHAVALEHAWRLASGPVWNDFELELPGSALLLDQNPLELARQKPADLLTLNITLT